MLGIGSALFTPSFLNDIIPVGSMYIISGYLKPGSARACKMGEPTRGGRAEPSSRDQKLRRTGAEIGIFLSSRPRTGLATTYITGYG